MTPVNSDKTSMCASEKSSGAPVAQMPAKSLKTLAPVAKSSGANHAARRHKKTPDNGGCSESAPLENVNFLRKLLHSAQLVNPIVTGASK